MAAAQRAESSFYTTVQDCPKGYLHKTGEICRKCGEKGVPVTKTKVKQDPEKPIEREILAEAITRIADGVQKLTKSGLNKRAIVVLLHDSTRLSKTDVERVLDGLSTLARDYAR